LDSVIEIEMGQLPDFFFPHNKSLM